MAKHHRIFICFAIEDATYRDLLVGQAKNARVPFEFVDMSVKEPWKTDWKDKCRTKMRGCDGVIALLSRDFPTASGALWEMQCANEEKIPLMGMYVSPTDRPSSIPSELYGKRVIEWTWAGIKQFIDSL